MLSCISILWMLGNGGWKAVGRHLVTISFELPLTGLYSMLARPVEWNAEVSQVIPF